MEEKPDEEIGTISAIAILVPNTAAAAVPIPVPNSLTKDVLNVCNKYAWLVKAMILERST